MLKKKFQQIVYCCEHILILRKKKTLIEDFFAEKAFT